MIRDIRPEDIETVKDIQKAQGFEYPMPNLTSPLILVKKVREVDGRVVAAMFLRLTAETFLVTTGSPVVIGRSWEELQAEVTREAYEKGLSEIVCVVPPEIVESFAPAMERLGWERTKDWPLFQRILP